MLLYEISLSSHESSFESRRKTTLFSVAYSLLVAYSWHHAGSDTLSSLTATQPRLQALKQVSYLPLLGNLAAVKNTYS